MQTLHERLLAVKQQVADGTVKVHAGICDTMQEAGLKAAVKDSVPMVQWDALEAIFRKWPKYSGDPEFPVPGPQALSFYKRKDSVYLQTGRYEVAAFMHCVSNGGMWDANNPYGSLRLELLDFCIEATKETSNDDA